METACSKHGDNKSIQGFHRKTKEKKPLGRPRYRSEDKITMDLGKIGFGGMNWIDLPCNMDQWWALVNMVMDFQVS
jgi:hypothetical protein